MNKREVVLVSMARTPIGNFLGSLSNLTAVDLGIISAREAITRANIKSEQIEDVTVGMVYKAGVKGNPARQIQLALDIPVAAGAVTIEQQCSSGMRALEIAAQQVQLGKKDICLVCGIESMSNVPFLDIKGRKGHRLGTAKLEDGLYYDALIDAFSNKMMAETAETLANMYGISRQEQDELGMLSQMRAIEAIDSGKFKDEIISVEKKTRNGSVTVDKDEHPRATNMEELSKLKPMLENGTITAGNASGLNDGACAVIIMSLDKAKELGITPLAKILSTCTVGVRPEVMGIGPVYSIPCAIKETGLTFDDIDYFEINEAFAAQLLACNRELKISMDKLNANGSGIALGHPVGCTGLRIVIASYYELLRRGQKYGCSSLCAGGGPSMATIIERLN